jgi:hypothetical protein
MILGELTVRRMLPACPTFAAKTRCANILRTQLHKNLETPGPGRKAWDLSVMTRYGTDYGQGQQPETWLEHGWNVA